MGRGRKLVALAATVAAAVTIAACGDDGDSSAASSGEPSSSAETEAWLTNAEEIATAAEQVPETIPSAELGEFTPKPGASIYYVACNLALEGCSRNERAQKAAAAAIGYDFKSCNGGTTADKVGQCFTNAINAKPDAIVVNGIGVDLAKDSFEAVREAGIPLIGSFTGDPPDVPGVATQVGGDSCLNQSEKLANWVIADSGGKANVLWVGTKTFRCNVQREESFMKTLATCDTCKAESLTFAIDAVQSALPSQLQSALQSNPDITYVVGTFDAAALAATDAIRQAGKTDKIRVAGFDGNEPNLQLVAKGDVQVADNMTGSQEPGWSAIDAAARVIAGEQVPPVLPLTSVIVTQENAAEIGSYEGPPNYQEQFEQLWGKR